MAALGTLEVELLATILEYIDEEHPQSTKSVALVNRHIYNISRLVSHRRKHLLLATSDDIECMLTKWLENAEAVRGIRHITVSGPIEVGIVETDDTARWFPFLRFIKEASRLKTLTWKSPVQIPFEMLEVLEKYHPTLQLKVYNFTRPAHDLGPADPAELALASSQLLVGINAKIWCNIHEIGSDLRECAFRRIVATAPNLQYVSILVDNAQLSGHRSAKQSSVESFYTHILPNPAVKTLTLDGYPLSKSTLEDWARFVDLSAVENIKCLRGGKPSIDYFAYALKVLPNLKHVSLNLRFNQSKEFRAAVENYLSLCAPLETLSLWSWQGTVKLTTILRHGPTLRALQLHEREDGAIGRLSLKPDDIKSIRECCPNMRDLTIDMRRESRDFSIEPRNDAICEELALFGPQLERIQIYFDLGIASIFNGSYDRQIGQEDFSSDEDGTESEDEEMEVYNEYEAESDTEGGIDGSSAPSRSPDILPRLVRFKIIKPSKTRNIDAYVKTVWEKIFGDRTTGPRELDVKFGEWEQKVGIGAGGRVGGYHALVKSLKSFWTVRPCVRDDQPRECVVERHGLD